MPTTAAQDEFNELIRDKDREDRHPEDRHHDSDLSDPESAGADDDYREKVDTDDELDLPADMRSNYYMPSIRSEANTGPKGVIADAQAFEQAKKEQRRFTWKKQSSVQQYNVTAYQDDRLLSSDEDNEDGFMRKWRESRLRELQNAGERIRSRTTSPSRRVYGSMPLVDGEGYLNAIEKVGSDVTVIVFIYDDMSETSNLVEDCMHEVARRNDTTRFIKFHYADAEIELMGVPAVLAYKGGEKFAGLIPLIDELPQDSELSALSLETCFRKHRMI